MKKQFSPYTTQKDIAPKAQPDVTSQLYREVTAER